MTLVINTRQGTKWDERFLYKPRRNEETIGTEVLLKPTLPMYSSPHYSFQDWMNMHYDYVNNITMYMIQRLCAANVDGYKVSVDAQSLRKEMRRYVYMNSYNVFKDFHFLK